jgi:hypothetical protein
VRRTVVSADPATRCVSESSAILDAVVYSLWSVGFFNYQGTIVTCHYDDACLGGSDSACGDGYGGLRCGQCADGWYKLSQRCRRCGSTAESLTLVVLLAVFGMSVIAFFFWQTLRDPRVGSPIVFITKMLETLSIMSLTMIRWPGSVATFLPIVSLVNFNTEMFQTEVTAKPCAESPPTGPSSATKTSGALCPNWNRRAVIPTAHTHHVQCILGRPHPTRAALMYVGGLVAAFLIMLLSFPLLRLLKRYHGAYAENVEVLESMCARLRPDSDDDRHQLGGSPAQPTDQPLFHKLPSMPMSFTPKDAILAATFKQYVAIALTVPHSTVAPLSACEVGKG